jgi:three-Cys-motif partner protein
MSGHKADKSFFKRKREWSKRKDAVLTHYLTPYLAKVVTLGKPVIIIDGFAGPGRYDDEDVGSPLLICRQVEAYLSKNSSAQIRVICVEQNQTLFGQLGSNLMPFATFAKAVHKDFSEFSTVIPAMAKTSCSVENPIPLRMFRRAGRR